MRLSLTFPSSPAWSHKQGPSEQYAAILPGEGAPRAVITYGPLRVQPDDPRRWQEQIATGDLPPRSKVQLGRTVDLATTTGWPLRLIEAEVLTAEGEVIEVRLCAFYTFMEHASAAIVRAQDRARLDAIGRDVLAILQTGRPDWSGEPVCLAALWDLEPDRIATAPTPPRLPTNPSDEALATALAQVDAALATNPTAADHLRRGALLLEARRPADALPALDAALAHDASLAPAHHLRGIALGRLGDHPGARAAWERADELAPDQLDTLYNLAQARFQLKDFPGALAAFEQVVGLDPQDFLTYRKIVQCLYALGRHDEGQAARLAFRERWQTTTDPRARFITEYVFDQFDGESFVVHAIEILRPRDPSTYALLTFRALEVHGDHEHPLPVAVHVETSEQARAAGTPFVLGVTTGRQYRVIGAAKELGPYAELKRDVLTLLREAVASLPKASAT